MNKIEEAILVLVTSSVLIVVAMCWFGFLVLGVAYLAVCLGLLN